MDGKLNDTLNASQILHLALQKMDGIIASNGFVFIFSPVYMLLTNLSLSFFSLHATLSKAANSDVESLSIKSDLVLSNEDVHTERIQSPSCYLKQSSSINSTNNINNHNNNNNHFRHSNGHSGHAEKLINANKHSQATSSNNNNNSSKKQDKLNRLLQELKDYSLEENTEENEEKKVEHFISENGSNQPVKPSRRYHSVKPLNGNEMNTTVITKPARLNKTTYDIEVSVLWQHYTTHFQGSIN